MSKFERYFGQPAADPMDQLFFPGSEEGYPVKATGAAITKQEEYDNLKVTGDFKAKVLTLPTDMEEYTRINDGVAKGTIIKNIEERHYDPTTKTFHVLISWIEPYACLPDQK